MDQEKDDVLFVDAYNLMYRAFHGNMSEMTAENGTPTNAIFTVSTMLLKLPRQFDRLKFALAVFDGGGNFRKDIDENYKANRKEMPESLKLQLPYIKQVFSLLGWPVHNAEGVEADDIIGSLAVRSAKKGFNTYIVSGDKDFRAISSDNLHILDTMHDVAYSPEKVFEKMGVHPDNVHGFLVLVGDNSDNVPGCQGIGPGTAAKLLNQYGSLEGVIANQHNVKNKIGEKLRDFIASGQATKSAELIKLKLDCDISFKASEITMKEVDHAAWDAFCLSLNMKSLVGKTKPKTPTP